MATGRGKRPRVSADSLRRVLAASDMNVSALLNVLHAARAEDVAAVVGASSWDIQEATSSLFNTMRLAFELPWWCKRHVGVDRPSAALDTDGVRELRAPPLVLSRSAEKPSVSPTAVEVGYRLRCVYTRSVVEDRKSTRLNSSHT